MCIFFRAHELRAHAFARAASSSVVDLPFRSAGHSSFVLLSNLMFVQNVTKSDSTIITLWSLPFEMQMYRALSALFCVQPSV